VHCVAVPPGGVTLTGSMPPLKPVFSTSKTSRSRVLVRVTVNVSVPVLDGVLHG
jgi:hypothetical protein